MAGFRNWTAAKAGWDRVSSGYLASQELIAGPKRVGKELTWATAKVGGDRDHMLIVVLFLLARWPTGLLRALWRLVRESHASCAKLI